MNSQFFTLLALVYITVNSVNCDNLNPFPADRSVPFHNFSSLPLAIADVKKYALHFNDSLNFPALLFAFAVKGKSVIKEAWGVADLENNLHANVNNKFRIGSISKSFAAAIIGQLVDQGKLSYDDLVYRHIDAAHFPQKTFNNKVVNISISQLLSHSAGIPGSNAHLDMFTTLDPPANVTQMILRFRDQKLNHLPGTVFEYSNNGFQVLGAVIEAVTGQTYQQVVTHFLKTNKFPAMLVGDTSAVIHNVPRYYSGADPRSFGNPLEARAKSNYDVCPYGESPVTEAV